MALSASVYLASARRHTNLRRLVHSLLDGLLLVVFALLAYRNIYPLATYWPLATSEPAWSTWSLFASLTIAALVVPLFQPGIAPTTLIETDATDVEEDSAKESSLTDPTPHPQLTASLFSTAFCSFMDPVVLHAFRKASAFSAKDLPPPRPSDRSQRLDAKYMPVIDPISRKQNGLKERSLLTNVMSAFKGVSFAMAATMVLKAIAEFLSPIALERLLT